MKSRIFSRSARFVGLFGLLILSWLLLGSRANAQTQPPIITIDAPGAGAGQNQGTFVTAINDSGMMTGYYYDANNGCHGFVQSMDGTFVSFDSPPTPIPAMPTCPHPSSINSSGVVAGWYADLSYGCRAWPDTAGGCGGDHGFVRLADGTFTTFDASPQLSNPSGAIGGNDDPATLPRSINSAGEITGIYATGGQGCCYSSFLRQPDGTFVSFDAPNADTANSSGANSINASGAIVGSFLDKSTEVAHGFLRLSDGTFTIFDAPGANTAAFGGGTGGASINSQGDIAGQFVDVNGARHGFIRKADGTYTVFDVSSSQCLGCAPNVQVINDNGVVVGTTQPNTGGPRVFLRAADGTLTLFAPGGAAGGGPTANVGMNLSGAVVGSYSASQAQPEVHGFLRPGNGAPVINSFTPASGPAGTTVTLSGANFAGTTAVTFNWTAAASLQVVSDTTLTADVPGGAPSGPIYVTNGAGIGASATSFTPTSNGLPTVSAFSPTSGPAGTTVTVTGNNFTGTTGVTLNGVPAGFFRGASDTQLTVVVPGGEVNGPISVTNTSGSGASGNTFTGQPQVNSFTPSSGSVGTSVTVTGINFTGVTQVTFNGAPAASFQVMADTQLTAVVPSGATVGPIFVTSAGGTGGSQQQFSENSTAPPTVSSFTPTSGTPGTQVTINGTNFTGTQWVTFNQCASFAFQGISDTQLRAVVPNCATTGPIQVGNGAGAGSASATNFTAAPYIASFSPMSGPVGTAVTLTGAGFTGTTRVAFHGTAFNDVPASFAVVSDTQINTTVPQGATTGAISATTALGTGSSGGNTFSIITTGPPAISSFSPTSGPQRTVVTITGSHFTGASQVTFNGSGVVGSGFTVNSDTQITASVPTGVSTGPIGVTTSQGTGISSTNFTVTAAPAISSFSPTSGQAGTTVTINGVGLSGTTHVSINGINGVPSANFTVVSDTQVTATVPGGATTGNIHVISSNNETISSTKFTALSSNPPTIRSFSPTSGPPGTLITVNGADFTGTTSVTLNGLSLGFGVASDTQLSARVPWTGATSGPITVTNTMGSVTTSTNYIVSPPAITSFSPTSGTAGTQVALRGSGFTGTTAVAFNGTSATSFFVASDTQVTAFVPNGATSGPITVTNPVGTGTSSMNFTVTSGSAPTITSFSPTSGPVGDTITINGSNFTGFTAIAFNGTNAIHYKFISDSQLQADVPLGATSGPITVVTNTNGTATSATNFTVLPRIASFSPTSGSMGTAVTITGSSFTGATSVTFNLTQATFTVLSDTQINATVPGGAMTGRIRVTTPAGTVSSFTNFSVVSTAAPTINSFSPTSGPVGAAITITGTNLTGTTGVTFNGTAVTSFIRGISDTQIRVDVPNGATSGPITVTNTVGAASSPTNFTVLPRIASFTPTSGPVGTAVTIMGTNLADVTAVTFNGISGAFTVVSSTQINATVPSGATTGPIRVTSPEGTATSFSSFAVN